MAVKLKTYPQIVDYLSIVYAVIENITDNVTKYPWSFVRLSYCFKVCITLMAKRLQNNDEFLQANNSLIGRIQIKLDKIIR